MFTTQFLKINFILGLVGFMFIACRGDHSKEPPVVLIQNMLDQTSYREQSKNDFFKDKRSMRQPVAGIVAQDEEFNNKPYYFGVEQESTATEPKWVTQIQIKLTKDILKEGQKNFNIYCAPCHGLSGHNDGLVTQKSGGSVRPANLHDDDRVKLPVGKIYDAVTNGVNNWNMPGFVDQLSVADRWAVVAYVRALQMSERATADDTQNIKK